MKFQFLAFTRRATTHGGNLPPINVKRGHADRMTLACNGINEYTVANRRFQDLSGAMRTRPRCHPSRNGFRRADLPQRAPFVVLSRRFNHRQRYTRDGLAGLRGSAGRFQGILGKTVQHLLPAAEHVVHFVPKNVAQVDIVAGLHRIAN